MDIPDYYFDDFEEDLHDSKCVQEIYEFSLSQVRGMVDYNDEDDVIQDVFYRLTKWPIGRGKYRSKRHYFSLLKITIRQAIAAYWKRRHSQRNDVRRRQFIGELTADRELKFEIAGQEATAIQQLQLKEQVRRVLDQVTTLSERHRVMFRLRFLEEKSHEEIASQLSISIRTSYRLEAQVRELLRRLEP